MTSTQPPEMRQLDLSEASGPGLSGTELPDNDSTTTAALTDLRTGPRRILLGPGSDPAWARPLLWLLLVGTTTFYLLNITGSAYANDFYAAAVKSGTASWKAWLFASLDSGNAITVDKPPAAMWIMGLSGRIFGFSSASMLIPEALMGVATVALMHACVKRWSGPAAGLVAGLLVALTPVAALMFRFNNPDALLVLLMTAAAYCVIRAIEAPAAGGPAVRRRRSRAVNWLLLAGIAIGFAFLTKMLQSMLVLPGFALAYLWAAPSRLWTRIWHLLAALGAVIVSAGWFVVLVAVWPAASRPYIGGSTDNSLWELAIGYNGLGRIFGRGSPTAAGGGGLPGGGLPGGGAPGGGAPGGAGFGGSAFGGSTGFARMFSTSFGSQISWLIPAALIALAAGLVFSFRAARTDRTRAALLLWGGWLVVSGLVFSFMQGIVHPYYAVALAPGIAGLVAIGGRELWHGRANWPARGLLAAMIAVTALWSFHLMQQDAPSWHPWLRDVTLIGGLVGAAILTISAARLRRMAIVGLVVGSVTALGGMTGWAVQTVSTDHTGATPTAGPASGGGLGGSGGARLPGGFQLPPGIELPSGGQFPRGAGGPGGFGGATPADTDVLALLNSTTTRWAAATTGAQAADGYILSSDKAVMAIGGFTGSDPSPTLAQFQQYVADGQVSYFIGAGRGGGFGRGLGQGGTSSEISSWVEQNFTATTVGTTTVYDLRKTGGGT